MIHNFLSTNELVSYVVDSMVTEFAKPGLVLLSAGKTFETEIYPAVNKYFENHKNKISSELSLSLVDEKITDDENYLFYSSVTNTLPCFKNRIRPIVGTESLIDLERNLAGNIKSYDTFIKANGGPRVIYFGLGSDPARAHVAYIGEEYLNKATAIINLSKKEINNPLKTQAVTIGTDIFASKNLEKIIVVVIGEKKQKSLEAALSNPNTGLGYLIKNYADKLSILCDFNLN